MALPPAPMVARPARPVKRGRPGVADRAWPTGRQPDQAGGRGGSLRGGTTAGATTGWDRPACPAWTRSNPT